MAVKEGSGPQSLNHEQLSPKIYNLMQSFDIKFFYIAALVELN